MPKTWSENKKRAREQAGKTEAAEEKSRAG
jgi:hypothetical protein